MTIKKAFMAAGAFVAAVAIFAVVWFRDSAKTSGNENDYSMNAGDYVVDDWHEKEERDGYTVTKYNTMGQPSIIVEYMVDEYPVSVTVTNGSKTTLIYAADYLSYDMYIEYRSDKYVISENFENMEEIIPLTFEWRDGTFMGTYSENEAGTVRTDKDGNIYYYDSDGNELTYKSFDEI